MAFYKLLEFYSLHLASVLPVPNPLVGFLATCPSPYLHHTASKEYTLVLDLDETLMHYNYRNNLGQFKIRPYCQEFIFEMSEHFEVGIFTCGTQDYADWVTSHLRGIEFKLYRHHAVQTSTGFIKDLKRLGRDLKKTIILDNLAHNFQLQKENGIEIVGWFGDTKDTALLDVLELLKFVIVERPEDVREGLRLAAQKISASNSLKYHS
jgi:CTD small phosphatase-like protein 2